MNDFNRLYHQFVDIEYKNELYLTSTYEIQYDMMQLMKDWYHTVNEEDDAQVFFHKIMTETNIFIGEFIKCCLKIQNMLNEIKIVCENDENYQLLKK